jgi:ABC-type multidrug transport system permease subunit
MSTNINLLSKGLKYLGILVILFIVSPVSLTIGFKALKKFENTPNEMLSYTIVIAAGALLIFTILFAFKTFKILLKAIFNN